MPGTRDQGRHSLQRRPRHSGKGKLALNLNKGKRKYVEDKATVETRQDQKITKLKERIFILISKSADIIKRENHFFLFYF